MIKIDIVGKASNSRVKTISAVPSSKNLNFSLMDFLRDNSVPIASSCYGEGVCQKCVVNQDLLSCQVTLKEFLDNATCQNTSNLQIEIDYL